MAESKNTQALKEQQTLASIGEAYYRGIGMAVNYKEAFRYFKKAADLGNIPATYMLGTCYELGRGTNRNMEAALDCYENASEQGNVSATLKLGDFYRNGVHELIPMDIERAADCYVHALDLAQKWNDAWDAPDIYLRLADSLFDGTGFEKDIMTAYHYYCMAEDGYLDRIDAGDAEADAGLDKAEAGSAKCRKLLNLPDDSQAISLS